MLEVSTILATAVFGWRNVFTICGSCMQIAIVAGIVSPRQVGRGPVWREMPEHTCISLEVGFLREPELSYCALWACKARLVEPAVDHGVNGTQKACVGAAATWLAKRVVEWYLVTFDWVVTAVGMTVISLPQMYKQWECGPCFTTWRTLSYGSWQRLSQPQC